jgi:hypothetical protein
MAKRLGQSWTARLVAITVSLALVAASVFGAGSHARGHSHHAGDPSHASAAPDAAVTAHHHHATASSTNHRSASGIGTPDLPESTHHHPECMDFVCHGGIAVLVAALPWTAAVWPRRAVAPWDTRALASVSPARLDRPPKPLVSA